MFFVIRSHGCVGAVNSLLPVVQIINIPHEPWGVRKHVLFMVWPSCDWTTPHLPRGRNRVEHPWKEEEGRGRWYFPSGVQSGPSAAALCIFQTPLQRTWVGPEKGKEAGRSGRGPEYILFHTVCLVETWPVGWDRRLKKLVIRIFSTRLLLSRIFKDIFPSASYLL